MIPALDSQYSRVSAPTMRKIEIALKAALVLVILLIPFRPIWGSYSIILLAAVAVLYAVCRGTWYGLTIFSGIFIALFLVRVVWLLRTPELSIGLRTVETAAPLIAIPLIFSMFEVTPDRRKLALRTYVIMCMCMMIYGFIQLGIYFQTSPYPFWEYTMFHLDPTWFWTTSRYFSWNMLNWEGAHYSFITIILVYGMHLAVYATNKTRFDKVMAVSYVILFIIFQLYSGSRVGLLCLIISALIYSLFSLKIVLQNKFVFAGLIIVAAVSIVTLMVGWGEKIEHDRYVYAKYALAGWKEYPLLGQGTGAGEIVLNDEGLEREVGWVVNHPHNQFFSDLLEYGIFGTIPLVVFIVLALGHGFTHQNKALLAVLITAIIFMLTESPLNSNKGLLPFVLVTSLLFKKGEVAPLALRS